MAGQLVFATVDPAARLEVTAGPLSATVLAGALRRLRVGGVETVRGLYGAVRDPDWLTIEPRFATYELARGADTFELRFTAECVREHGEIDFAWSGRIRGEAEGSLRFELDGVARRTFRTARIGLCVLHPLRLSGQGLVATTPWGVIRGRFPDLVTSFLPFSNLTGLRHDLGRAHETLIAFGGDLFQMEDQRAFTDGSFKTFGRPLELAWPYTIEAGTPVHQLITVTFPRLDRGAGVGLRRARAAGSRAGSGAALIRVGGPSGRTLPRLGTCVAPPDVELTDATLDALGNLRLDHLRATVIVTSADALERVRSAARQAAAAGCALDLAIVARADDPTIDAVLAAVAESGAPIARLAAFDPASHTTPASLATRIRQAATAAGLRAGIAGGSRGYFYQLLERGIPADLLDLAVYPASPQVHGRDETTVMEGIEALPGQVRTARSMMGGGSVGVAPVSLKPHVNPDLHGDEPPVRPGGLPARYDERQGTVFAAAFTLGCIAALADAGADVATLHEAAGWGGLVGARHASLPPPPLPPGIPYPAFDVLAAMAGASGAPLRSVNAPVGIAAVAVELDDRVRLLLASLEPEERSVELARPAGVAAGLPEIASLAPRSTDGTGGWMPAPVMARQAARTTTVAVGPYGLVRADYPR